MRIAAVLALLVLGACAPLSSGEYEGDPTENAIAASEAALNRPLSDRCRDHALNVDIEYASILAVQHACKCTDCGGCMDSFDMTTGGHVWLMDDAPAYMVAHETVHVILACVQPHRSGDPRHSDAVWHDSRIQAR